MAARTTAARTQAIEAAGWLIDARDDDVRHWSQSEYVRGVVEILADTFGADVEDHDQAREAIYREILAAQSV